VATKDKLPASVTVSVVAPLMVNPANTPPLLVIVPVLTIVTVKPVYVPPEAKVRAVKFRVVVAGVPVLPVKSNSLNQPVIVATDAPLINDKLGALVIDPPVVPKVNVLATDIGAVNPPVPV